MDDRLALRTLLADYAPLLSPHCLSVYLFYMNLRNEKNEVQVTYNVLREHLGLAYTTINNANKSLQELGLIQPIASGEGPQRFPVPYKVPPIRPLTVEKRKELYEDRTSDTKIRRKLLAPSTLPTEYLALLDLMQLKRAYDKLGMEKFTLKNIVSYFKLDNEVVRLYSTNLAFRKEFSELKQKILDGEGPKTKISLVSTGGKKKDFTIDDRYDLLMQCHKDKDGNEIPVDKWKAAQLLRHFFFLYEKYNGRRYVWTLRPKDRPSSFSSKEIGDVSRISKAFDGDNKEIVKYFEWAFKIKQPQLKNGALNTGFLASGVVNDYFKDASNNNATGFCRLDPIDESFKEWIDNNVSDLAVDLVNMDNLYWLKVDYNDGDADDKAKTVVEEGIKRGIIPKEGNIAFKQ